MKTYKRTENDVLKLAVNDSEVVEGVEVHPVEAMGLYSEAGELVGVRLPEIAFSAPRKRTAEEIETSRQAFLQSVNAIPRVTLPEGKPFDPVSAGCGEKLADDDPIYRILESIREPEPWRDPWF